MSFEDWYNPNRATPGGRSGIRTGLDTGVTIGSMFGPAGAALGGAIGTVAGGLLGSSGARRRAIRRATDASYSFASELYDYSGQSKSNIRKQYDRDVSLLMARSAASGGSSSKSFNIGMGKLREARDTALGDVRAEVDTFREGPNYKFFREDYERVTGVNVVTFKGATSYNLGGESRGSRDLPDPYAKKYLGGEKLRVSNFEATGSMAQAGSTLTEYWERLRPSMGMYEKLVFGGNKGRKKYAEYMAGQVKAANKWYDRQVMIDAADAKRREQNRLKDTNLKGGS